MRNRLALGRPRDPRIDHTVLAATRELLAESGYGGLTVDAVAARAGVGKPAIYRRFGSKAELAFAAVNVETADSEPLPDTGSLRGDLLELAQRAALRHRQADEVILPVLTEAMTDPQLSTHLQAVFVTSEHTYYAEILERACRRGELTGPLDPAIAHLLLAGPLFAALFVHHQPLTETRLGEVVTAVAAGLRALAAQTTPAPPQISD